MPFSLDDISQAEDTLYRQSIHFLTRGSDFFASAFSINNNDPHEGKSDDHPIVLPPTIRSVDFDAYLSYGVT